MYSEVPSNINLNNIISTANTQRIGNYLEPGIPKAIILVPQGQFISAANMADPNTFLTFLKTKTQNANRAQRWFLLTNLDDFQDKTKDPSNEDTGLLQLQVSKFQPLHMFRYMQNFGNFQELIKFNLASGYNAYYVDDNGTVLGKFDPTGAGGLYPRSMTQFFVYDAVMKTTKANNEYRFQIQWSNRAEFNENQAYYAAGLDLETVPQLENAWLKDITSVVGTALGITTTTTMVIGGRMDEYATDLFQKYGSSLNATCFVATDLNTGTALTISSYASGLIVVGGLPYYYGKFVFSAAPTATHLVQIALADPATVNGVVPGANIVTEIVSATADGQNAAVHTF